ncbi:hypothetical protein DPMN_173124 [Dreissena polymorpha]|uniref:Uncharacterized protein n=1 Tax=Dreissena polymorpha TaxID=45954 RepID=A0A9D4E4H3_DREPO|nr:hypothetical protein DPMN_173124 [Dreissena polymorpha]
MQHTYRIAKAAVFLTIGVGPAQLLSSKLHPEDAGVVVDLGSLLGVVEGGRMVVPGGSGASESLAAVARLVYESAHRRNVGVSWTSVAKEIIKRWRQVVSVSGPIEPGMSQVIDGQHWPGIFTILQ